MSRTSKLPLAVALLFGAASQSFCWAQAADEAVFRSDVSLVRVDVQVLDRSGRAVTGMRAEDFQLRVENRPEQIRNFASENMPVDVLLLLDVSASMRPHVQRIASAAHQAFQVLGKEDRVGIMVFDRTARVRLPFRGSRDDVERELDSLLRQERFNGGTDITLGLIYAAHYVERNARRNARRAIVILTDDQTQLDRDEAQVGRALTQAEAVLSLLLAPDAMQGRTMSQGGPRRGGQQGGGSWPGAGGGGWPGSGGVGGPLGGIILGRRGPYGGQGRGQGGPVGGVGGGGRTHSAGTAEIAKDSGGDSLSVDDASALETTLNRIRQRYALHFNLPEGIRPGQSLRLDVQLSDAAARRYPDAELRFRRVYQTAGGTPGSEPATIPPERPIVTRAPVNDGVSPTDKPEEAPPRLRRRPAVSEPGTSQGPLIQPADPAPIPPN